MTNRNFPTQPPGDNSVMTKPEIRHAGIVDVTFGENVTLYNRLISMGAPLEMAASWDHLSRDTKGSQDRQAVQDSTHLHSSGELVTIGNDCFISHGVMFINDLFVWGNRRAEQASGRSTNIGNHVSVGTNATVLPVTICDQVVIGAGAVVTKDITVPGVDAGNPRAFSAHFSPFSASAHAEPSARHPRQLEEFIHPWIQSVPHIASLFGLGLSRSMALIRTASLPGFSGAIFGKGPMSRSALWLPSFGSCSVGSRSISAWLNIFGLPVSGALQ